MFSTTLPFLNLKNVLRTLYKVDVEITFDFLYFSYLMDLVVKAYQYTSLTSVMLLDCWTIPCCLLLTWLFIKTRYNIGQLVGVCCCILGLVLVILSDVHAEDRSSKFIFENVNYFLNYCLT